MRKRDVSSRWSEWAHGASPRFDSCGYTCPLAPLSGPQLPHDCVDRGRRHVEPTSDVVFGKAEGVEVLNLRTAERGEFRAVQFGLAVSFRLSFRVIDGCVVPSERPVPALPCGKEPGALRESGDSAELPVHGGCGPSSDCADLAALPSCDAAKSVSMDSDVICEDGIGVSNGDECPDASDGAGGIDVLCVTRGWADLERQESLGSLDADAGVFASEDGSDGAVTDAGGPLDLGLGPAGCHKRLNVPGDVH
ncbi:hypothetical protein [Streptomyces sp. NRRL F-5135]|uniref:hypothetical protein n=1 Tax=Streptomyces sp. NRRL F-5135 TaxID=1463858 RepID=UPI00131DCEE0|nr:hypothetical protein [Streptomyces sp. NRRL F-5135]